MQHSTIKKIRLLLFCSALLLSGCKKYLDEKPDKELAIPSTVDDLQALLDYNTKMNTRDPYSGEASSDNYFLLDQNWSEASEDLRRMYQWKESYVFSPWPNQWSNLYDIVFVANTVLDNIDKVSYSDVNKWKDVKGQALCFRAKAFLQIAGTWTLAYDSATAGHDLGIPLRLTGDFNVPSQRSTLQQTYEKIIADLQMAAGLLPDNPVTALRPSKPAAYGLLARTYLSIRDYSNAGLYADSALRIKNTLIDFNSLNANATRPIARFNSEVIMDSYAPNPLILSNDRARIDTTLYNSYDINDLRRKVLFRAIGSTNVGFKGNYAGNAGCFTGIAVNELLLTRAECYARQGRLTAALDDLNTLLIKRWKDGTFIPVSAGTGQQALVIILQERRKDLLYTGNRWLDIKRLNKEGYNITLKRIINGETVILPPNDLRYALAIPEDVISLSGIPQNPR